MEHPFPIEPNPTHGRGRRDDRQLPGDLRRLHEILRRHAQGLREYDLLEILRGKNPLRGLDELQLFQVHFLLFHHLHRLRCALEYQGCGSLEVHCLRIRLAPLHKSPPNPDRLPRAPDPVARYYLDLENLRQATREDVRQLLQWFWKRYRVHGRLEDALAALGLGRKATPREIRTRFRELMRRHHPDRGGDPEHFRRAVDAMEVVRLHERGPAFPTHQPE